MLWLHLYGAVAFTNLENFNARSCSKQALARNLCMNESDLEIYQYLSAPATKRLLEVDLLTSIDLSSFGGMIVYLRAHYVYVSKSSGAKDCRTTGFLLRTIYAQTAVVSPHETELT